MAPITEFSKRTQPDTIVLFDVDGTLTPARGVSFDLIWIFSVPVGNLYSLL